MKDWAQPAGGGSCSPRHDRCTGAVHEVMPAETDARAEKHRDNRTKAVGSQLRSVHGRWLTVCSQTATPVGLEPNDDGRRRDQTD